MRGLKCTLLTLWKMSPYILVYKGNGFYIIVRFVSKIMFELNVLHTPTTVDQCNANILSLPLSKLFISITGRNDFSSVIFEHFSHSPFTFVVLFQFCAVDFVY